MTVAPSYFHYILMILPYIILISHYISIIIFPCVFIISYPIGSMYVICGNIYYQYTPNVSIYTYIPYMDPMGIWMKPPASNKSMCIWINLWDPMGIYKGSSMAMLHNHISYIYNNIYIYPMTYLLYFHYFVITSYIIKYAHHICFDHGTFSENHRDTQDGCRRGSCSDLRSRGWLRCHVNPWLPTM